MLYIEFPPMPPLLLWGFYFYLLSFALPTSFLFALWVERLKENHSKFKSPIFYKLLYFFFILYQIVCEQVFFTFLEVLVQTLSW